MTGIAFIIFCLVPSLSFTMGILYSVTSSVPARDATSYPLS